MGEIIEVQSISKYFKSSDSPAIKNVSFTINKNEIFGLIGPNGAGKTTTISILCGLYNPTKGTVKINGFDLFSDLSKVKHKIGIVPQDVALYPTLTGRENLEFYGAMYGIPKLELKREIDNWLNKFEMRLSADKQVYKYSGGMKRRINLIAGILHKPDILFLDEPTVGIDVKSRASIMFHLNKLNDTGMTIIYTSHHLEEAEKFCSDLAIINSGKVIARGSPKDLIDSYDSCEKLEDVFFLLTKK